MENENIGAIAIDVVGNYAPLEADLQEAVAVATSAGEKIAEGLNAGAAGADAISGAMQAAAAGAASFEDQVSALVASGSTLAEALAQVSQDAHEVAAGVGEAATAAGAAAAGMEALGEAEQQVGEHAGAAAEQTQKFSEKASESASASHEAEGGAHAFLTTLLEFAGISLTLEALKEFATEAINVYAATEKAQIAIGFLKGDAQEAAESIEKLKDVAMDLALPFDQLVKAEQKMTAFGLSTEQTTEAIRAAADAAAATGNTFDQAASSIERMVLGGMAGTRQLVALGLSAKDMAEVMGVAVEDVQKDFKALDESVRADVITEALAKWKGAAEEVADSTSGSLQKMSTAWHLAMDEIGKAISPAVIAVAHFASDVAFYMQAGIVAIKGSAEQIGIIFHAIADAQKVGMVAFVGVVDQLAAVELKAQIQVAALTVAHDASGKAIEANTDATDKNIKARVAAALADNAGAAAVDNVHRAMREFVEVSSQFPTAAEAAADATDALQIKVAAESMALAEAQRWLDIVMGKYREHNATASEVVKALDLVNSKQAELNRTMGELPDTSSYLKGVAEQLKDAGKALTDLLPPISKIPPGVRDVTSLLNDMGIKVDDVHNIFQSKLLKDYDELQTKSHTLDEENAAWEKISGSIGKIAKVDLPAALKLYDEHYAQLVKDGAAEGVLLDTESKRLQMIIQIDETTGASATKQVVALELVRLKQQALYDETHLLGDTYVGVINDILKGWDSLGKSIADNIIDEKNWGEVFINTGKQVAKMILETLVGSAFKALKDSLIESTGLVDKLTSSFTKLLGGGGGSQTDLGGWMNSIAGGGAKTATAGAQSAAGISSAIGTAGAIGGIVSAISGIIGNFQMSDLYGAMKAVALNTLSTANEVTNRRKDAWDQHNGLLDKLDMVFNRLGDVWEAVNKGAQSIVDQLSGMQAGPVGGGSAGGGAVSGGGSQLAPPPNYMGSDVNPSVTPYWMMQNVPTSAAVGSTAHFGASPAATQYQQAGAAAGGVNLNGPITIAVNGAGSPMETARALADTLRNFSSKFGPYSQ